MRAADTNKRRFPAPDIACAIDRGSIVICDVVYAELAPAVDERRALDPTLREIGVQVTAINTAIAWDAGTRWGRYRRAGGPRQRILADILIGAHASVAAEKFLTRDRGFFSTYFPELDGPASG